MLVEVTDARTARPSTWRRGLAVWQPAWSPAVQTAVRPLVAEDIGPLMRDVGPLVDSLYDAGAEKLLRRLQDARDGYARAHVVTSATGSDPIALAAEVQKGTARVKLSTFWVAPGSRRTGIGSLLLDQRLCDWQQRGVCSAAITVRRERAPELEALFVPRGFTQRLLVSARYGNDRDEVVLMWEGDAAGERTARSAA
jgi:GNAT superfamily N-acetyltransferase